MTVPRADSLLKRKLLIAAWVATVTVVVGGSLTPGSSTILAAMPADGPAHFAAYAVLAVYPLIVLRRGALAALLLTALLGVTLECIQPLAGRVADVTDVAANSIGLAFGAAGGLLMRRPESAKGGGAAVEPCPSAQLKRSP